MKRVVFERLKKWPDFLKNMNFVQVRVLYFDMSEGSSCVVRKI